MFKRKHYKFTNKKTSRRSMLSFFIFLCSLALLCYGLYLSFQARGNGGFLVGLSGFGSFVLSTAGLILGMEDLKNEDLFHTFSWIGAVGNAIIWFGILLMILIGI